MRKVAVSVSNGDNIEKLAPLLGVAAKFAAKKFATDKLLGGGDDDDKKPNIAGAVANTMQQQAEARKQRQQNQIQNNMQMADKAKNNAQISTGEPMDMSWRLLKDWSWNSEIEPRTRQAIIERARKAKKKQQHSHIASAPSRHHDDQFNLRYHPHQKMPKGAEGLEPHEIAAAMADMYLENHPELKQALHEELPQPADPNRTNTPGMVFHALNTDNPKTVDNTRWTGYSPVVAKPTMFDQIKLHSAIDTPAGSASNRHTIRVSSMRDYPHTYSGHNDVLPSMFNLSAPLTDLPTGGKEAQDLRQQYRIRQLGGSEEKWRDKISTVEDEKQNKIEQNLISRLHNEAMLSEREDAKQAKQFEAQQAREQHLASREQGEMSVTPHMIPGHYIVNDPAYALQGKMVGPFDKDVGQGYDYYHNHYQNTIQTGEPMDLAWRMLKQMSDEQMQEWAYENLRNQGIVIPDEREEEVVPKPKIPTLYY